MHVCQGREEAADFISLRTAYWRALLCTQLSTEGTQCSCQKSAAQVQHSLCLLAQRPHLPSLHSCKRHSSTLKPSQQRLVQTQPPVLPCSAADVGFSRLLSNTHLSMQSGAAGTYAYAGEAGPH